MIAKFVSIFLVITVFVISRCTEVASDSFINWGIDAVGVSVAVFAVLAVLSFVVNNKVYILLLKRLKARRSSHD